VSVLPIRVLGDPILRRHAEPVKEITDEVRRLVDDMFETMYAAEGIGLAAPQVGAGLRVFVADVNGTKFALINPELVTTDGGTDTMEEGCLSIPDIMGDVKRPSRVVMRATDIEGQPITVEATGLLGRCMQHEMDHLNGRLFIDHLSFLKKRRALAEWTEMEPDYPGHVRILVPGSEGNHELRGATEEL